MCEAMVENETGLKVKCLSMITAGSSVSVVTMGDGKLPVEKFNGSDFGIWRMRIEDYMYGKDLYLFLGEKPEEMKDAEWKLLERKAISVACRYPETWHIT